MILVDTDVLIEFLRGSASAADWLKSMETEQFAIPGIVAIELVMGCRTKSELAQIKRFLAAYQVIWPDAAVCSQAPMASAFPTV